MTALAPTPTPGVRIAYDDLGSGEPALLFTTGWCSSRERWSAVARRCAGHRRVLSCEWRGHGASDPAGGDFGLEEMIEDALAVADAAGVERFVPCAASHSGFVAVELRRRCPERVPALVHVDWYVIPPPPAYRAVLAMLTSAEGWSAARDKLFEIWRAGVDDPAVDEALAVMRRHDAEMWMRSGREIAAGYARVGSPADAWASLDPSAPVLHVYGQPHDPAFLEAQEAFGAAHPWFTVRQLPGMTHFAMIETPAEVAEAIESFVRGHVTPGAPAQDRRPRAGDRPIWTAATIGCPPGTTGYRSRRSVVDSDQSFRLLVENYRTMPPELIPTRPVDLLVAGSGVAGLFAALCAASEADVLVVSKGPLLVSASSLAQGGIAAAIGDGDEPALHAADTHAAGRGLCRNSAVSVLTEEASARIRDLVDLGVDFDEGLSLEGGHSRRRVVHAGGAATGDRIATVLARRVLAHPRIRVAEGVSLCGVLSAGGRAVGALTDAGAVFARATLLATGGSTALWARTTNPSVSVGDGIAAAYAAGAAVADLEFTQFHPTALRGTSVLLSEALRGEGALLLDEAGDRFTDELAPRDVVARAIAARGSALLDLRAIDRGRFPTLMDAITGHGFDPGAEPIPVSPAAHYSVGGIATDLEGRSELPSLYAAGECAATGVHGANRLASNSLLECLVFGRRAALAALEEPGLPAGYRSARAEDAREPVTDELRAAVWEHCGLFRDAAGLERLRSAPHGLVRLVAEAALRREESRGCHFRTDHPDEDATLARHVVLRRGEKAVLETWR